jgi:F0F1-type ATP synthase membrane subunit c/vacuolar-type H+-ATPase subunit K
MKALRLVLGFLAGAVLVASSFAHSILGWKAVQALLEQAKVPADLQQGLAISVALPKRHQRQQRPPQTSCRKQRPGSSPAESRLMARFPFGAAWG